MCVCVSTFVRACVRAGLRAHMRARVPERTLPARAYISRVRARVSVFARVAPVRVCRVRVPRACAACVWGADTPRAAGRASDGAGAVPREPQDPHTQGRLQSASAAIGRLPGALLLLSIPPRSRRRRVHPPCCAPAHAARPLPVPCGRTPRSRSVVPFSAASASPVAPPLWSVAAAAEASETAAVGGRAAAHRRIGDRPR